MATRRFCCLIDTGVTPTARSRNHVAWSKRETYICEFMGLVKSYSEASTAPLKVCTQSAMMVLSLSALRYSLSAVSYQPSAFSLQNRIRVIRGSPRCVVDLRHKLGHLGERCSSLVAVRRVPALRQHDEYCPRHFRYDGIHLRARAVLVLLALDAQHRTANGVEVCLDVPPRKLRIEPDVIPCPKRFVHMRMVARELGAEISGLERNLRGADAGEAELFDKDMRSFKDQRARTLGILTGEDQRDGAAVAMPQQDRPLDAEPVEQFRQHDLALVVHEGYEAPPPPLFGAAMPIARVHQHTASGAAGQRVGKILPQRDGAETLVQHDDGGDGRIAGWKPGVVHTFD